MLKGTPTCFQQSTAINFAYLSKMCYSLTSRCNSGKHVSFLLLLGYRIAVGIFHGSLSVGSNTVPAKNSENKQQLLSIAHQIQLKCKYFLSLPITILKYSDIFVIKFPLHIQPGITQLQSYQAANRSDTVCSSRCSRRCDMLE